jgi:hypothetical protein
VRLVVEAFTKLTVDDATRENGEPLRSRSVVVAEVVCPYTEVWVKGSPDGPVPLETEVTIPCAFTVRLALVYEPALTPELESRFEPMDVLATTCPVALVERMPYWMLEMVRAEVEAAAEYRVPEAERLVVEAPLENVCSWLHVLAVVVPNASEKALVEPVYRMGYAAVVVAVWRSW